MKYQEFCYWLQGAIELGQVTELNEAQVEILNNHLAMTEIHEQNVVLVTGSVPSHSPVRTGIDPGSATTMIKC